MTAEPRARTRAHTRALGLLFRDPKPGTLLPALGVSALVAAATAVSPPDASSLHAALDGTLQRGWWILCAVAVWAGMDALEVWGAGAQSRALLHFPVDPAAWHHRALRRMARRLLPWLLPPVAAVSASSLTHAGPHGPALMLWGTLWTALAFLPLLAGATAAACLPALLFRRGARPPGAAPAAALQFIPPVCTAATALLLMLLHLGILEPARLGLPAGSLFTPPKSMQVAVGVPLAAALYALRLSRQAMIQGLSGWLPWLAGRELREAPGDVEPDQTLLATKDPASMPGHVLDCCLRRETPWAPGLAALIGAIAGAIALAMDPLSQGRPVAAGMPLLWWLLIVRMPDRRRRLWIEMERDPLLGAAARFDDTQRVPGPASSAAWYHAATPAIVCALPAMAVGGGSPATLLPTLALVALWMWRDPGSRQGHPPPPGRWLVAACWLLTMLMPGWSSLYAFLWAAALAAIGLATRPARR